MKKTYQILALCAVFVACRAQQQQQTTPVPILKQINKQNDDGSYSFGYEAADGSFKIETKYPNGDVAGKYGYVDETGKMREVEYGASSKRGFEPIGNGINVPPPTIDESNNSLAAGDVDDGQYREDPSIYYKDPKYNQSPPPSNKVTYKSQFQSPQYQQPQIQQRQQPAYEQQNYQPLPKPPAFHPGFQSQVYQSQPQFSYQQGVRQPQNDLQQYQPQYYNQVDYNQQQYTQPQYTQPQYTQPQYTQAQYAQPQYSQQPQFSQFAGHPAQNFDVNTGSYSISFTG